MIFPLHWNNNPVGPHIFKTKLSFHLAIEWTILLSMHLLKSCRWCRHHAPIRYFQSFITTPFVTINELSQINALSAFMVNGNFSDAAPPFGEVFSFIIWCYTLISVYYYRINHSKHAIRWWLHLVLLWQVNSQTWFQKGVNVPKSWKQVLFKCLRNHMAKRIVEV